MSAQPKNATTTGARRRTVDVHEHVRQMILDGTLPPGSVVTQAELARTLGVSRTPLREAFRMLQREGLIEATPDHRGRIAGFDAQSVDQMYAARILMETLAVSLTVDGLEEDDVERMGELLSEMERTASAEEWNDWQEAHRAFHGIHASAVTGQVRETMSSFAANSGRYVSLNRHRRLDSPARAHGEHERILQAIRSRDRDAAVEGVARHLASTALTALTDLAPDYEPIGVRSAVRMVLGSVKSV